MNDIIPIDDFSKGVVYRVMFRVVGKNIDKYKRIVFRNIDDAVQKHVELKYLAHKLEKRCPEYNFYVAGDVYVDGELDLSETWKFFSAYYELETKSNLVQA